KSTDNILGFAIIDPQEEGQSPLSGTLQRAFKNSVVASYKNMTDFLVDLDPKSVQKKPKQTAAFPVGQGFKIIFDDTLAKQTLRSEPELTDGQTVFGLKKDEFLKF